MKKIISICILCAASALNLYAQSPQTYRPGILPPLYNYDPQAGRITISPVQEPNTNDYGCLWEYYSEQAGTWQYFFMEPHKAYQGSSYEAYYEHDLDLPWTMEPGAALRVRRRETTSIASGEYCTNECVVVYTDWEDGPHPLTYVTPFTSVPQHGATTILDRHPYNDYKHVLGGMQEGPDTWHYPLVINDGAESGVLPDFYLSVTESGGLFHCTTVGYGYLFQSWLNVETYGLVPPRQAVYHAPYYYPPANPFLSYSFSQVYKKGCYRADVDAFMEDDGPTEPKTIGVTEAVHNYDYALLRNGTVVQRRSGFNKGGQTLSFDPVDANGTYRIMVDSIRFDDGSGSFPSGYIWPEAFVVRGLIDDFSGITPFTYIPEHNSYVDLWGGHPYRDPGFDLGFEVGGGRYIYPLWVRSPGYMSDGGVIPSFSGIVPDYYVEVEHMNGSGYRCHFVKGGDLLGGSWFDPASGTFVAPSESGYTLDRVFKKGHYDDDLFLYTDLDENGQTLLLVGWAGEGFSYTLMKNGNPV